MKQHTKGPWHAMVLKGQLPRVGSASGGVAVMCTNRFMGEASPSEEETANAVRIAVCVNFLEGIDTETLRTGPTMNEILKDFGLGGKVEKLRVVLTAINEHLKNRTPVHPGAYLTEEDTPIEEVISDLLKETEQ